MSDHPFTYDRWATPDDPEFGIVRIGDLRKIERACLGIWAIASDLPPDLVRHRHRVQG